MDLIVNSYLLVAAGLAALFVGGELLVRGAVAAALRLGISAFVVGVVVVGFGTSMPELLVSVRAALAGTPAIALGNVIGSNIANILLIAGIGIAIAPVAALDRANRTDVIVMLVAGLAATGLLFFDTIGRAIGLGLLVLLAVYLGNAVRSTAMPARLLNSRWPDQARPPSPSSHCCLSAVWPCCLRARRC